MSRSHQSLLELIGLGAIAGVLPAYLGIEALYIIWHQAVSFGITLQLSFEEPTPS